MDRKTSLILHIRTALTHRIGPLNRITASEAIANENMRQSAVLRAVAATRTQFARIRTSVRGSLRHASFVGNRFPSQHWAPFYPMRCVSKPKCAADRRRIAGFLMRARDAAPQFARNSIRQQQQFFRIRRPDLSHRHLVHRKLTEGSTRLFHSFNI